MSTTQIKEQTLSQITPVKSNIERENFTDKTNNSTPKLQNLISNKKSSTEFSLDNEKETSVKSNSSSPKNADCIKNSDIAASNSRSINANGSIELIMGPMFSGKSTELLRKIRRYNYQKRSTVVVSYIFDTRYSKSEELVSTHDCHNYPAIKTGSLKPIKDKLMKYDVIGVDEGQFYPDLVEVVEELANIGKTVIISCLSGNFKREPFEAVTKLIPKCEKMQLLTAICSTCGSEATYTFRTIRNEDEVLIGGEESYKPVCRLCYMKNTSQEN